MKAIQWGLILGLQAATPPACEGEPTDALPDGSADGSADRKGEVRLDGADDDGNGLVDDTPLVMDLLRGAVRHALESRNPESGIAFDHAPLRDFDGPGPESPTLDPAAWIFPQLLRVDPVTFSSGASSAWSFGCEDTAGRLPSFFRFEATLGAGSFAGVVLPADVDLREWDSLSLRYRLSRPGRFELKLEYDPAAGLPALAPHLVRYEGAGWQELRRARLEELFPGLHREHVAKVVLATSDGDAGAGSVQLDVARFEFHPTAERRVATTTTCGGRFVDPVCREVLAGADKTALSLLLIAAADRLGIDVDGRDLRAELEHGLEGLRRVPRWNGQGVGEPFGDAGLPPNWFGSASGLPSPADKHLSLTDLADLVAAMMVFRSAYDGVSDRIVEAANAELDAMLPAVARILRPAACEDERVHGAFLPAPDGTGNPPGHSCTWIHNLRLNDTLLGTFLGFASGAVDPRYWVTGLDGCPVSAGAAICANGESCTAGGACDDGCALEPAPGTSGPCTPSTCWYHTGNPTGDCSCKGVAPPGVPAGGLYLPYKPLLFLYGGPHSERTDTRPALPLGFASLGESAAALALAQIRFAESRGVPYWGQGNTASPDVGGGYLVGCCVEAGVAAPHVAVMAVSDHPRAVGELLERYREAGVFAPHVTRHGRCAPLEWGSRDSVRFAAGGAVSFRDHWAALDQGLLGLSLVNHLTGGWLRRHFSAGGGAAGYRALEGSLACGANR